MIQTGFESRVKVQQVIENQLPNFILDESPNAVEFLKQYYISQEYQSGPIDIAENLDQYLKLDNLTPEVVVDSTYTVSGISSTDTTITVSSTKGFPQTYGLLKIDDEIITYTGLTTNTFTGCIRAFSGITSYHANLNQEELVFSPSTAASHILGSSVQNLSSLFLKEFYKKIKYTFTPGLEEVDFVSNLNVGNFIKEARSFYQAKGTDESFRILFNILYGVTPQVVNLEEFLIKPSSAEYVRREVVIAERISGDPSKLMGQTIQKFNDESTSASISEIEPFTRNNIQYFKISLFVGYEDFSAVLGNFTITPNTKSLKNVAIGSSVISVDSTIGFPEQGKIITGINTITYTSKSINQFFGCTGITSSILSSADIRSDEIYFGYENGDLNKKVELRLTGVLSKFVQVSDTLNLDEGQKISVKNIGDLIQNPQQNKTYKEIFANSWIYNTGSRYEIENVSNFTLKSPIDRSSLKIGDEVEILERDTNNVMSSSGAYISNIFVSENRVIIDNSGFSAKNGVKYDLRRKINTANSTIVPIQFGNNVILSDIQNLYTDDKYAYVASNSLPSGRDGYNGNFTYKITKNINSSVAVDLSDEIDDNYTSIVFQNPVPFITGDRIYYQPSGAPIVGLDTGDYYVQVLDPSNKIRLYSSLSFVGTNSFLTFSDSDFVNQTHRFTLYSQKSGIIGAQKLFKKFPLSESIDTGNGELTLPGSVGMLINGVEINNYKSNDKVYYGPLESISVLNGGIGYDVINPPLISVSPGSGSTALVHPVVSGSIEKVYIDSQDYDINTIVSIGITGGNGSDCVLEPILTKRRRDIFFDGRLSTNSGGISSTTNQLVFLTDHNLSNGELIVYNSNGNSSIGIGTTNLTLINNATYYSKIDNNRTIKLFQTNSDYLSGINTVSFNGTNAGGIHKFSTASFKNTISEIKILNGGSGYTNRELIVSSSGISTYNNTINFENHGFESGELITYRYETSTIGISTLSQYYVLKNNDDSFRLCDAGIGGTNISNYNRKNYIKFSSVGSGYQYFSYPDISVFIQYTPVGFGTTTQQIQSLVATPVVKGSIIDAYLYETGTGYGSTILNLEKKPLISIKTGSEAKLKPIIVNGQINSVNIQYGGIDYYSTPDLVVTDLTGAGSGADLRPVITNQKITDIKIVNPGIGYSSSSTIIEVRPAGSNAILNANIRSLTVNNNVKFGDEILIETENQLQYSVCGYFENLRTSFGDNGLQVSNIIGWAYDGNPIYGPYGYSDSENSNSIPKLLESGYTLNPSNIIDRPSNFAAGFFIEDYEYTNSGDLDENNGRFGKTPEFPNGVYAYFTTLDTSFTPKFPYFIGNKFRSNTIEENSILNQTFNFNNSNLLRNTLPYKVSDNYAKNDFIIETNEITTQESIVESVSQGFVSSFDIINSGSDYKVNDVLNFDDTNTFGGGLIARVSSIEGKDIVKIDTSVETYENSIFTYKGEGEVEVTIKPHHNLSNNDFVAISGFSTNLSKLNNSYKIGVSSYYSNVLKDIPSSTSGFTTEIYITQLPTTVSVGSSIRIGSETLSVLEVYKNLNILKVQRGSTGVSHTATTQINFIPDSFIISQKIDYFESNVNNKVFFNPVQSVGIGTTPGITNKLTFEFGDSNITRIVPTQGIYIENHPFTNNQQVIFSRNGLANISISTSPTGTQFDLPQNVYVTDKNINTIGIKTTLNSSEVFFITNGDNNDKYSFESVYPQIIGRVERVKSTVSVSTSHELSSGDVISLSIKPNLSVGIGTSTSVYVKRDTITGNILINPIGFSSTGINTSTNTISINSHNLKTGDKILYSSNVVASGLSTGLYYVYRVNDNTIKLSETYLDSKTIPPTTVSIAGTGGSSQSISLINPQIESIKNNNLVFNLSDNSLAGYKFKLYYDQNYNNEFVSTPSSGLSTLSGIGTVGVSTNASLTINYSDDLPTQLYYNLEKSGYISTSDTEVNNYSEILFTNSVYNSNYTISGVGATTFTVSLSKKPEKLTYTQNECDKLKYTTTSLSAKGPIDRINIISGGSGYKKLPTFIGSNSISGKDAYITAKSTSIGNVKEVRIINEGFEYSSDKTLQPTASISPLVTIKNSNTIGIITVTDGGRGYTDSPSVIIVNSDTGEKIDSGILEAKLSGNSIDSVSIIQQPKGLPETSVQLFTTNNTNGISIQQVQSSSSGIFTCFITTPTLGFSTFVPYPFSVGDKVFVEGIQKFSTEGTGFNSEDYGYEFFTISSINTAGVLDSVTINISGLTTNTGIAKTIQDSVGNIIKRTDYPTFNVTQIPSKFIVGEKLISNNTERDLEISSYENSFIKVSGTYELSVGEIIVGKDSGNIATIDKIESGIGRFKIDYSVEKNIGWSNDIGKLDQDNQVIPDNDYYQNLSYTVKSPITYQELRTPVNSLVHTSGLKNFADMGITSTANSGITTSENFTTILYDIIEENRVDTIYDFDLVKDIDVVGSSSKFLKLKNKKLTDYIECRSNVVLKIDNINRQFSDADGNPSESINLLELNSGSSYDNILVRVSSLDNTQIQLTELVLLNDGNNSFLAEKSTLVNTGVGLTHISGEPIGKFILIEDDADDNTYLRFIPNNPFDIDYDVKLINSNFNSSSPGIGTTSIGFINLTGSNKTAASGIQTSIISVESNKFSSLYLNVQIVGSATTQMNFAEVYLTHDGTDTYISEYYFDSEFSSNYYSGNNIGIFTASISPSGILSLNYINNSSNSVDIRSKIVGFGTTSVGTGAYRFISPGQIPGNERSVVYQSTYSSTVSSASTVISLNKSNFNAVKSLVEVSVGSTSALHQIMLVQDETNIYVQQSPFLSVGSTNGIGTFGGEYSGSNFILKFYPEPTVTSKINILAFNQCLYTTLDTQNIAPTLSYGTVEESIDIKLYNAINGSRINKTDFNLNSNGIEIFRKRFNPINPLTPDPSTGIFTIQNHFFSNLEKLIYTPKSTFIGVGASAMQIGAGTSLPSEVYVIKLSDNTFKLATSKSNAISGIGVTFTPNITFVGVATASGNIGITTTFISGITTSGIAVGQTLNTIPGVTGAGTTVTSIGIGTVFINPASLNAAALSGQSVSFGSNTSTYGSGNAHQLEMDKKLEKALITIDNVVQYPLLFTPISYTLLGNGGQISAGSSIFALSGISTIIPKDILKIDDEYMGIINVGLGTTNIGPITNSGSINLVEVTRGFVGSSATTHTDSTSVKIYKGSYNIVDSNIFFTESPRGNPQIIRDSSNLTFETSDFTGRVFLRNDYTSNQLYDDISSQFTGIGRTFTLTVGGANTVGLGTTGGNGILFINGVFQTPTTLNNPENNFSIIENTVSGISSVVFSGITSAGTGTIITSEFDVNQNQTPRGGIIISLGSSTGLGYAPLVGAAVTAVVGAGGSIVSVGLGTTDNLGSGYNGIVAIGVSVYQSGHIGDTAIITASVGAGGTLSFTVGSGGTGYTNPKVFVSEPSYENLTVTGVSRLGVGATTDTGIGLLLNVEVGASSTTGIGSTYFEVSRFSISRQGYSFQRGDVFKPVGLVTAKDLISPLSEFQLTVVDTFSDSFAAWQFGEFDYIDSVKNYQDGIRTRFPLFYNNELLSFELLEDSQVNLSNALLIVINGVIQDPGVAYQFDGGTSFVFTTAPRPEDNVAIFFYKGTDGDDVVVIDTINETLKRGDTVQVLKNNSIPGTITQDKRTIFDLSFSDKFETNLYSNQGVDSENNKPLSWIKQKVDRKINGEDVYKTRDSIESLVYPTAKIIKDFSTTDNQIFVDNAEFFKYDNPEPFGALIVNGISTTANGAVELISNININQVNGFSGIITGITTTTGSGGNPLALTFYLKGPVGFSGLQVGYPIYIFDTRVGNGVTSIDTSNSSIVGIGTTFLDNIYYIHQFSSSATVGIITCNILSTTSTTGLSSSGNVSNPVGKYSWGRMSGLTRSGSPISIGITGNTVDVGLSTFATIQRRGVGIRQTGALPKLL
jgi:hypothetical protein